MQSLMLHLSHFGCEVACFFVFFLRFFTVFWANTLGILRQSLACSYPVVGANGFVVCGGEVCLWSGHVGMFNQLLGGGFKILWFNVHPENWGTDPI